jgi:hypothetical protein
LGHFGRVVAGEPKGCENRDEQHQTCGGDLDGGDQHQSLPKSQILAEAWRTRYDMRDG